MNKSVVMLATTISLLTASAANAADKVEIKLSGQVSRAITYADNGTDTDTLSVDNTNSGTRFRLTGKMNVNPNLKAGVAWETQYQDNSSFTTDIGDSDDGGSGSLQSRKRELWFQGGFGKVSLGKGDGAANGTSEVDFSGTGYIADYSNNNLDDGLSFADAAGNKVILNRQVFSNFDGLSRNDRIRYDAPAFGPVGVAISAGQDKAEIGLRYKQALGGGSKIGAALGYVGSDNPGAANNFKQLGLSASYITSSGFNVTGAYGKRDLENNPADPTRIDPQSMYIKLGQKFGQHAVSVSYNVVEDLAQNGDEAERVNLAYVYKLNNGIELFGMAQNASLDRTSGADLEDVKQISIGSRIKF